MQAIQTAITEIEALRNKLGKVLAEHDNLLIRCNSVLLTLENGLRHTIGGATNVGGGDFVPTPITEMMGIKANKPKPIVKADLEPKNADVQALRDEADKAYRNFLERDNDSILANMEDIVIRAVAKKAGMDVTSTVPEKIDEAFIISIKAAIETKAAIELAKQTPEPAPAQEPVPAQTPESEPPSASEPAHTAKQEPKPIVKAQPKKGR